MTTSSEQDNTPTGLRFLSQTEIGPYLPANARTFAECPDPTDKDVAKTYQSARLPSTLPALVFLGIDDRESAKDGAVPAEIDPKNPKGVAYFAVDVTGLEAGDANVDGAEFVEPRLAGSSMGGWEANIVAQARALMGTSSQTSIDERRPLTYPYGRRTDWNTRYKFCPGCGSPTYSLWCGWKRGCGSIVGEGKDGYGQQGKTCPST